MELPSLGRTRRKNGRLLTARTCSKPVIAACNGSAAGGVMEIALSCDMVVASDRAKFGCTEVGLGIVASTGGIVSLARDIFC